MDLTRAHRGFAGYDWASSGYVTVVTTAVGGPYLDHLAHGNGLVLPLTLVLAVAVQAVLLPLLGRRVDRGADPVGLVRGFAVAGGGASVALAPPRHDDTEAVRSISRQTQKGRPGTGRP